MKRSKAVKELVKVLESWEGSKLCAKTARELLTRMEELGMSPPWTMLKRPDKKRLQLVAAWEPEGTKREKGR